MGTQSRTVAKTPCTPENLLISRRRTTTTVCLGEAPFHEGPVGCTDAQVCHPVHLSSYDLVGTVKDSYSPDAISIRSPRSPPMSQCTSIGFVIARRDREQGLSGRPRTGPEGSLHEIQLHWNVTSNTRTLFFIPQAPSSGICCRAPSSGVSRCPAFYHDCLAHETPC